MCVCVLICYGYGSKFTGMDRSLVIPTYGSLIRTFGEGKLKWPGMSAMCHFWAWIKGMNQGQGYYIPQSRDAWIMAMDRGYRSPLGVQGVDIGPYIFNKRPSTWIYSTFNPLSSPKNIILF